MQILLCSGYSLMIHILPFSEKKSLSVEHNKKQKSNSPYHHYRPNVRLESQNFFLLHLSILREYLQLEFDHLESSLDFTYDFERIIDDFILLAFFVGNDFLPNLQYLHINEGALAYMFEIYKRVLPSCGGYVNEKGIISLDRLEIILIELEKMEYEIFEMESENQSWLKSKQTGLYDLKNKPPERKSPMVITP